MTCHRDPRVAQVFGEKVAVADLTLSVEQGEVFGFLGPNGAGKTTSIKMLLGLITPSGGDGRLLGTPLGDHQVRRRVGFLPEHFRFHDWLTAAEFLGLHADLYQMSRQTIAPRIRQQLELVGLSATPTEAAPVLQGMLQRIGGASLLNRPEW
jgi:ABC-2 type transport system ATP-binding protein